MSALIKINKDNRGILGVIEFSDLPFMPQRTFWISDVPTSETRGNHAHHRCEQFIMPLRGSVHFSVIDAERKSKDGTLVVGDGLYLPAYEWIVLQHFSEDSVVMVYCSEHYDPSDYITNLEEFLSGSRA